MNFKINSISFSYENNNPNGVTIQYTYHDDSSYSVNGNGRFVLSNEDYDSDNSMVALENKSKEHLLSRINKEGI